MGGPARSINAHGDPIVIKNPRQLIIKQYS